MQGCIYLKNAKVEALPEHKGKKNVLKIEPVCPRRPNLEMDATSHFYLQAPNADELDDWFQKVQGVASGKIEQSTEGTRPCV